MICKKQRGKLITSWRKERGIGLYFYKTRWYVYLAASPKKAALTRKIYSCFEEMTTEPREGGKVTRMV
jgi:hypothetical protein